MKTFYFDTGVKPVDVSWKPHHSGTRNKPLMPGQVWRNGTKQIPFDCDVPDGAVFKFACDNDKLPEAQYMIVAEIHNSAMISKFAYFQKPIEPAK